MASAQRQFVRFLFLSVDPAWRRLSAAEQRAQKEEFGDAVLRFHARLLLRTFSLSGTRGDADLLLWQVTDELETLTSLQTALFSTRLGGHLRVAYSYLGMTRRSIYTFPDDPESGHRIAVQPQDARFLFVYPFVKTRAWYALPHEERQVMMEGHVRVGRQHPDVRLNTVYSYGLDDQEFVLAFETDDPGDFLDLVLELRETRASSYTLQDTPIFTCVQMSLWDALDSLGGAAVGEGGRGTPATSGPVPVASLDELTEGVGKRVYLGSDAIALFRVGDRVFAVNDRCSHGRASLSEGRVTDGCALQCPWHGGRFDLETGAALSTPARVAIKTYEVTIRDGQVCVG